MIRNCKCLLLPFILGIAQIVVANNLQKIPDAVIGRGGVTFDFAAASERIFAEDGTLRDKDTYPVSVRCTVPDMTDGTFHIGSGQVGYLWFEMKKNGKETFDPAKFECRFSLPDGVELVAERSRGVRVPLGAFNSHDPCGYLVRAGNAVGEVGNAVFSCWYDGKRITRELSLRIIVTKPVVGKRPKRFMTGMHGCARIAEFPVAGAAEEFADFVDTVGVSWGVIDCSKKVRDIFQARGIKITPYDNNYFVNGFMVGHYKNRPESDKYVPLPLELQPPDSTSRWFLSKGSCPIAIYSESDYFRTNTVPLLKSDCEGYDGFWANWEPYFYANRGCFCQRCKEAFAEYAKIDIAELNRHDWYELVRKEKSKYRVQWLEFRAREHGRVVRTIDKYVRKFTRPGSFGFVPGVCWIEMSSWYPPIQDAYASYAKQVRQIDFAGDLKWINPWGPYPSWSSRKPYKHLNARSMQSFFAAKDVREQVAKDYPEGKRPKLLAFPMGNLGSLVPQPEWIEMGIDSFFFHRWEAAVVYYIPRGGLDARFWQALANASTRAAKYEDIVFDGVALTDSVVLMPVKQYPAPCDKVTDYLPEKTKDQMLLQHLAYVKDGKTIVAVFNFWEKGGAFFDLKVKGFKGCYCIVDEDGTLWCKSRKDISYSAEELVQGVRLQVGAARTKVFEILPYPAKMENVKAIRTLGATLHDYESVKDDLSLAFDAEVGRRKDGFKTDTSIALPH